MSFVSESIGSKFERFLLENLPDLEDTTSSSSVPDFHYSPSDRGIDDEDGIWVEAKVGNWKWGVRLKPYQTDSFGELDKPVIYAVGFHDFNNAYEKLTQKTRRGRNRYLDRHMGIKQVCFVTRGMMELLFDKEVRTNGRETIEYCLIKPSVINNLFERRDFVRSGNVVDPEGFYEFSYDDFKVVENLKGENGVSWRGIFSSEDKGFIDFLEENGFSV